jgi:hypothetical protein
VLGGSASYAPEVVARIVHASFARLRLCYELGLRANPELAGDVVVRFVIDRSGAVSTSAVGTDTTLADPDVNACIARQVGQLSFPRPEGGIVTVVYGLSLTLA